MGLNNASQLALLIHNISEILDGTLEFLDVATEGSLVWLVWFFSFFFGLITWHAGS